MTPKQVTNQGSFQGGPLPRKLPGRRGSASDLCAKCGAWRGDLGREPLHDCLGWARGEAPCPVCYVCHLRTIFGEVRRVLREDGTCWINLDDSMATHRHDSEWMRGFSPISGYSRGTLPGLKERDLCAVPWRVALALQQDGWYLRSAITGVKVAPMPESVQGWRWERCRVKVASCRTADQSHASGIGDGRRDNSGGLTSTPHAEWLPCPGCPKCDPNGGLVLRRGAGRPTEATEMIFLLAKGPSYFYDTEAVRRALLHPNRNGTNPRLAVDNTGLGAHGSAINGGIQSNPAGGNAWNWLLWEPEPLREDHFAAYPSAIPEFCIKAGTSERGCCPACGAPWARVVERELLDTEGWGASKKMHATPVGVHGPQARGQGRAGDPVSRTLAWKPTCPCPPHDPAPCVILDPFAGAGTTLVVADRLGRDGIGIELNPQYAEMAQKRLSRDAGLFAEVAVEERPPPRTQAAPTPPLPLE